MEYLSSLLSPLTRILQFLLEAIVQVTGSYGLSIMLLSVVVSVVLTPITALARRLEEKDKARQDKMAPLIANIRTNYRGQERFEKTDEVYQQFDYHPIKSMASLLPLFVQLPFLLAALFLLVKYPPLVGNSFLFIPDLSQPDGLIALPGLPWVLNLLPIALTGVAVFESMIRMEATRQSRQRFLVVAIVLLFLIYRFPASVSLYWLTSNLFSLFRSLLRRFRAGALLR
jgi:YidC/Oxa1 family membrane protein insertase